MPASNHRLALLGLALCCTLLPAVAATSSLQVLHWWTSTSERRAANLLAAKLREEGVEWKDGAIPGGAGIGAGKVLKSRVLAHDSPDATQIIGASIGEWAELGLLLEFDNVAAAGAWQGALFPSVYALVQHRKHVVAAPLGIHRINILFYNRKLFARLKLAPASNWAEFELLARKLRAAGVVPLVQSSEPWQVATLFENLVLAESGPDYYRELFVRQSAQAALDKRLLAALGRLRTMKGWMQAPLEEQAWTGAARRFARREAAMLVMGDWAKAELNDWGFATDDEFSCATMPGTGKYHLFSVDTLSMFTNDYARTQAQEKLARLVVTPAVQQQYNAIKGSVSVRRDADPAKMDSCARDSWHAFAKGPAWQAPSLVHRMAADEESRDAIIAEVHRFFINDSVTALDTQRRLAAILRTLNLRPKQG
ncbi:MAG: ABC transporter substrate-binding protein [Pseudomonadota bacterium]